MSAPTSKEAGPSPAQVLAAQIYISLVGSNVEIVDGSVKMKASPENLAKLSLKLAEAFYTTDDAVEAAKAPKTSYKLDATDIAQWTTK